MIEPEIYEVEELPTPYMVNQRLRFGGWRLLHVFTQPPRSPFADRDAVETVYVMGRTRTNAVERALRTA